MKSQELIEDFKNICIGNSGCDLDMQKYIIYDKPTNSLTNNCLSMRS